MSFTDGFEAIDKIKKAGSQLSETVSRVEALGSNMSDMQKLQSDIGALLSQLEAATSTLQKTAQALSDERKELEDIVRGLPALAEGAVEKKLKEIVEGLEARFLDRLRDELSDTRSTLRDALENNARRQNVQLEETKADIISEMPRTLFGQRGR